MHIGLLSDTHGYLDDQILAHLADCDEIWHGGDIGSADVTEKLRTISPVRAVYGNVDGPEIRRQWPDNDRFQREGLQIWMTHIAGYPPRYHPGVMAELRQNPPDIFVCGHTHILRVMRDAKLKNMLYLNPGAAGQHGFHLIRTLLKFEIKAGRAANLRVIELGKRGR